MLVDAGGLLEARAIYGFDEVWRWAMQLLLAE